MSNFEKPTLNPRTKKIEQAVWMDNYFGPRLYGVYFKEGKVYQPEQIQKAEKELALKRELEK